jgi:hypothetical protein
VLGGRCWLQIALSSVLVASPRPQTLTLTNPKRSAKNRLRCQAKSSQQLFESEKKAGSVNKLRPSFNRRCQASKEVWQRRSSTTVDWA